MPAPVHRRGEAQQRRVVAMATDELEADQQPPFVPRGSRNISDYVALNDLVEEALRWSTA